MVAGVDVAGLPVALACRYSDGEQRAALEEIFTGRLGGDAKRHFPWAWKVSELVADELVVDDGALAFRFRGVCGYGSTFDYSG